VFNWVNLWFASVWNGLCALGNSGQTLNVATKANWDDAVPEYWDVSIMHDADRDSLFSKLSGNQKSRAPLIEREDLTRTRGDQINFNVLGRLIGKGVTGTTTLEGAEEKLRVNKFSVTVDEVRHATAADHLADAVSIINFTVEARKLVSEWLTRELDDQVINRVVNTDTVKTIFPGGKTTRAQLGAGDLFGPDEIKQLRFAGQRRGVMEFQQIRGMKMPYRVFAAAMSEWDYYSLSNDSDFKQDHRLAGSRGKDNPAINTATDMYQGIMIYIFGSVNVGDGAVGSFLRPEAVLATALTAGESSPTSIVTGDSAGAQVTNVDYYKYFPTTGTNTILINQEEITYTAVPGDSSVSGTRAQGGSTQAAHAVGDFLTLNNLGKILLFGQRMVMRAWSERPTRISQERDYRQEKGLGIRYINGVKGVEHVDATLGGAVVMETWSPNPGTI